MKKLADMDPKTKLMLSGILDSGLAGAGIGAASMGAADLLGSSKNEDRDDAKRHSLLKSMMMGGLLGGVSGAGLRSGWNAINPEMAKVEGSGLSQLFGYIPEPAPRGTGASPNPSITHDFAGQLASNPGVSAITAGSGLGLVSKILQHKKVRPTNPGLTVLQRFIRKFKTPGRFMANPLTHGGVAGAGVYGLGKMLEQPMIENEAYNTLNTPESADIVKRLLEQHQGK